MPNVDFIVAEIQYRGEGLERKPCLLMGVDAKSEKKSVLSRKHEHTLSICPEVCVCVCEGK